MMVVKTQPDMYTNIYLHLKDDRISHFTHCLTKINLFYEQFESQQAKLN